MTSTPLRAIRIPDAIWRLAKERATENDENVTNVIRRALIEYVRESEPNEVVQVEGRLQSSQFDAGELSIDIER